MYVCMCSKKKEKDAGWIKVYRKEGRIDVKKKLKSTNNNEREQQKKKQEG